jgi:hypothetical protein
MTYYDWDYDYSITQDIMDCVQDAFNILADDWNSILLLENEFYI